MKRKILLLICVLACLTTAWCFLKTHKYYEPLVIKFGRADTPYTEVKIEGKPFFLDIDLGSKFDLGFREDVLDEIERKKVHGMGHWKIPNGNEYEAPNYIIPKVTLGNLKFSHVIAQQFESESLLNQVIWSKENSKTLHPTHIGSIGRPLLQRFNWLMDYCRTRIIATNDLKKIGEMGYFLHQMQKMPFTIGLMGINIQMNTKWGIKNFSIDTGSSVNLIRSSILEGEEGDITEVGLNTITSECTLEGRDLGNITFYSYALTPKLTDIDGILGTPFLDHHILYIDFTNKTLYFRKSQAPPW